VATTMLRFHNERCNEIVSSPNIGGNYSYKLTYKATIVRTFQPLQTWMKPMNEKVCGNG